ncbi:hypothetical protein BYT27DRAFT_7259082 [Phlegmacium glaucopus]|nr:hypothetical protein BYT27DRAFT_7259082 [Phlegmacium glaucopus]
MSVDTANADSKPLLSDASSLSSSNSSSWEKHQSGFRRLPESRLGVEGACLAEKNGVSLPSSLYNEFWSLLQLARGTASSALMGDGEVIYEGFPSVKEAHAAWDEYCMRKNLPPGLAVPARGSRTPTYHGSPSRQVAGGSHTPQHIPAVCHTYHSTARTPPPPYLSQNVAIRAHSHGSVSLPLQFDTIARANAVGGVPSTSCIGLDPVKLSALENMVAGPGTSLAHSALR